MGRITWADKTNKSTSSTPATQKLSASDMNEIKTAINSNDDAIIVNANSIGSATTPQASTGSVLFDTKGAGREYSFTTPAEFAFDLTGAVNGGRAVIWYQGANDPFDVYPNVSGASVELYSNESFAANRLMKYVADYRVQTGDDLILIDPLAPATSPPEAQSPSITGTVEVGSELTFAYTFFQAQDFLEDLTKRILEIYIGDSAADVSQAEIEAGNVTVHASQTNNVTWTPTASEETKYVSMRIRVYTTDTSAPGSEWAYVIGSGPIAASSAFDPTTVSAIVGNWQWIESDDGAVGTLADNWETVYNQNDGTNGTDFVQSSTANQASVANQSTENAASFDTNDRYWGTSWTDSSVFIAASTNRTYYICFKTSKTSGTTTIFQEHSHGLTIDLDNDRIWIQSSSNATANGSVDFTGWVVIKMHYDSGTSLMQASVIYGATSGTPTTTNANTTLFGWQVDNSQALYVQPNESLLRVVLAVDSSVTAQNTTDIETWLTGTIATLPDS